MTSKCPTCGQALPMTANGDGAALLTLLREGVPHREVYRGTNGRWYMTHGGGEWSAAAVQALVRSGYISPRYSNLPDEVFHVGKTIDVEATLSERKKYSRGKDAPHRLHWRRTHCQ